MGTEIKRIMDLRSRAQRIAGPIEKKIDALAEKSSRERSHIRIIVSKFNSAFNYLLGKSLDNGPKIIGHDISLTSRGIHTTGVSYDKVNIFKANFRLSKNKKEILFNDSGRKFRIPLSYFQSDMRKKIKRIILEIKNIDYTQPGKIQLSPEISFSVLGEECFIKDKGNEYCRSLYDIRRILNSHSGQSKPDVRMAQLCIDELKNFDKKVFAVLIERQKNAKNLIDLIVKYSIPFKMMEKLKRNSS